MFQTELFSTSSLDKKTIYYLLFPPGEPIYSKAVELKKETDNFLKTNHFIHFRPHITLLQFPLYEDKEEQLVSCLNTFLVKEVIKFNSGEIKVYDSSRTLYISLEDQENGKFFLKKLCAKLIVEKILINNKKSFLAASDFHITIAKGIEKQAILALKDLLPKFSEKTSFTCDKLVLLKSKNGNAPWDTVSTFSLS